MDESTGDSSFGMTKTLKSMKKETIEASAVAVAKAKEIQQKMVDLFKKVKNENKSILTIVQEDLQETQRWNSEQIEIVIDNLRKGIQMYNTQRQSNNVGDETLSLEDLNKALEGMSDEQQKEKLIAALSILYYVKDTGADLKNLRNDWEVMSIDALKDLIVEYTNKEDTYGAIINQMKDGLEMLDLSAIDLPEQFGEMTDDYKLYVAAQIFIGADNIDEESLAEQSQAIGASSAAAVDIVHETMRLQNNEISEKTWHTVVKGILAALMACVIFCLFLFTSVDIMLNVFFLFTAVFGYSFISVLLGMILGYALVAGVLYILYQGIEAMDGEIIEDIDTSIEQFLCKVDEWIASFTEKVSEVWEELKNKYAEFTSASQSGVPTPVEADTQEEPVINQPVPVPVSSDK